MSGKDFTNIEDKDLLERYYQQHDNYWLGILLPRYTLLLFGVCMKYLKNEEDAKDAVQQIFVKVINELRKYKVDYFKSWIYMIAKNYCLMQLRNSNKNNLELKENIQIPEELNDKDLILQKEYNLTQLQQAFQLLNEEQKKCIDLFYLQHRSYQDISNDTGYSLLQVKSFIQNGKRNLRQLINNDHNNNDANKKN